MLLILEPENNQTMVKDLPQDLTLLLLLKEQRFVNKVRVALYVLTHISFSGLGYVPTGSATSIVFGNTPANSYLVFINDNHDS